MQEYDLATEPDGTWHVFDPRGVWIAIVRVPRAWRIQDIGQDYILGLTPNDLDVDVVQRFRLERSSPIEAAD